MKRDRIAKVLTVGVLLLALAIGVVRKAGWRPAREKADSPQDAIYAMLNAARAGNVNGYLASYAGKMEAALRQTAAEHTAAVFAKYLRESNALVKGVAVSDPQTLGDGEVKVRVEYIYGDRNEAQSVYLEKSPRGWKIVRTDADERVSTPVPYGTPIR